MSSSRKILWPFEVSSYRKVRRGRLLLFLNFFCKTMLPHQGYSRPENPKRHGFDSSIKLGPLQNYSIMNLQNHGLSDRIVIILMVLQNLQDYASHFPLQYYGSPSISVREELFHGCFERTGQTESSEEAHPSQEWTESLSLWCCKRVSCRDRRRKKKA